MLESLHLTYDGIYSQDMKVLNVNSSSGLFEEFFLPDREIHEQSASNREKPYFLKISNNPLSFSLRLLLDDDVTDKDIENIAVWLFKDDYKPLVFSEQPNRIFYALLNSDSNFTHNGLKNGYIDISVRCDSPYAYTPEYFEEDIKYGDTSTQQYTVLDSNNINDFDHNNLRVKNGSIEWYIIETWGQYVSEGKNWGDKI